MPHLVSIVVPAYNAARRIEPALLSIAAQDYGSIEIIVVDDGSSDGTGDAAERVLRAAGRGFKIIRHDVNMGVSAARNSGLRSAAGSYVVFFDADDGADPNFISALLGAITENQGDAAFCGYRDKFGDEGEERPVPVGLDPLRKYSAEELVMMYIFNRIRPALWSTIFKRSFLKAAGLEFTVGCGYGEDIEFLTKALSRCGAINFSTGCHYIYVHHEGQVSQAERQTPEKFLRRYTHNAEAVCRAARYAAEHGSSAKVREAAGSLLLAEGLIKTMNAAARQRDEAAFYRTLDAPETRRVLRASLRYGSQKPEVFLKAAALLLTPGLYYRTRSRA